MVSIKVVFGSSEDMRELRDDSIALVITSPPYYNAPFDFPGLFKSYDDFLSLPVSYTHLTLPTIYSV